MADEFQEKLAEDFFQFVKGDSDDIKIKIFLCGEGLDESRNIEDQVATNLRAYLKVKLEEQVKGCVVTLAEHKKLIDAYNRATDDVGSPHFSNLTEYELRLADWADVIVILVSTPGSIAELGMFAVAKGITPKLLIFFDPKHGTRSYIWNGPIKAADHRGSKVITIGYNNTGSILEILVNRIRQEKSIKRSGKLLAGER